jgi:hypothetical protein
MAKAEKFAVNDYNVVLTLNKHEAETLLAVTGRIGGPTEKSRRQFMENIGKALSNAEVNAVDFKTEESDRAIYFSDEVFND